VEAIIEQDIFGPDIASQIKFKGKSQHKTLCGGMITIVLTITVIFLNDHNCLFGRCRRSLRMKLERESRIGVRHCLKLGFFHLRIPKKQLYQNWYQLALSYRLNHPFIFS
jgi:hypothetical protein